MKPEGTQGRFPLAYGAHFIPVAAAMAEDYSEIDGLLACGAVGEAEKGLFKAGTDPETCDGHGRKPLDHAISAVNAAFIEAALDAGADPAGSGDAVEDARGTARYFCPVFGETRAYRRLMLAASRLRLHED